MAARLRHNTFIGNWSRRTVYEAGNLRCASTLDAKDPRPFREIPHKKGYPLIGNFVEVVQNFSRIHLLLQERHEQLGPIFREKTGPFDMVSITDVDGLEQLLRHDGPHPDRNVIPCWMQYRMDAGEVYGIILA